MLNYSPFERDIINDPYPTYRRLRDDSPAFYNQEHGFFALSRYADVTEMFRDEELFTSQLGVTLWTEDHKEGDHDFPVLPIEPEENHRRLRRLIARPFQAAAAERYAERFEELASQRAADLGRLVHTDLVANFVQPFVIDAFADIIGVLDADRPAFHYLLSGHLMRNPLVPFRPGDPNFVVSTMERYKGGLVEYSRKHAAYLDRDKPSCPLGEAAKATVDNQGLDVTDLTGITFMATVAGAEDVIRILAAAIFHLSVNPAELARLLADLDDLAANAIDEIIRYDASTQYLRRTTTRDITIHGTHIPAGSRVVGLIGSANRDERIFTDPDALDITRGNATKSLSFASGPHICPGIHFAREMLCAALTAFLSRHPKYRIHPDESIKVHSNNVVGFSVLCGSDVS